MPLEPADSEILEKAYLKAAGAARDFSRKYRPLYSEEADFYDDRAAKYEEYVMNRNVFEASKSMKDEALYIAEKGELDNGNIEEAKKYKEARSKLWN